VRYRQAAGDVDLLRDLGETPVPHGSPALPPNLWRESLSIPDIPEEEVVRHFTRLSQMSFGVDSGFYPLGSCTMKYNPKFAEVAAASEDAQRAHPYQDEDTVQGCLQILHELQDMLASIAGMEAVSLQPAAGAQAEFTGLLMTRAYHEERGEDRT
jgi:glycine dehydrogenase subunit 2